MSSLATDLVVYAEIFFFFPFPSTRDPGVSRKTSKICVRKLIAAAKLYSVEFKCLNIVVLSNFTNTVQNSQN